MYTLIVSGVTFPNVSVAFIVSFCCVDSVKLLAEIVNGLLVLLIVSQLKTAVLELPTKNYTFPFTLVS